MNLVEKLKDVPTGTELYSPVLGTVMFKRIDLSYKELPIVVKDSTGRTDRFSSDGKYYSHRDGECVLFPSKENRDWSKFQV